MQSETSRRSFLAVVPAAAVAAAGVVTAPEATAEDVGAIYLYVTWDRWNKDTRKEDTITTIIGPYDYGPADAAIKDLLRHGMMVGIHAVPSNRIRLIENHLHIHPLEGVEVFTPGARLAVQAEE